MLSDKNKYRDTTIDLKNLYRKEILQTEVPKINAKKQTMKIYKLTENEEKTVYKLVNRDILKNDGMDRIELGDIYQIGTFVKEKKKTI